MSGRLSFRLSAGSHAPRPCHSSTTNNMYRAKLALPPSECAARAARLPSCHICWVFPPARRPRKKPQTCEKARQCRTFIFAGLSVLLSRNLFLHPHGETLSLAAMPHKMARSPVCLHFFVRICSSALPASASRSAPSSSASTSTSRISSRPLRFEARQSSYRPSSGSRVARQS